MSNFDKAHNYDVYDYQQATRPEQAQDYTTFPTAHPQYSHDYLGTQAQPSSILAHAPALPYLATEQAYAGPHDQSPFYAPVVAGAQHFASATPTSDTTAFLESAGPRQVPTVLSYTPTHGSAGSKVTVHIRCQFDILSYPPGIISIMFGHKRCDSVISRSPQSGSPYQYMVDATAPAFPPAIAAQSQVVNLALALDGPIVWSAPSVDIGNYTYSNSLPTDSPSASRKRKLSDEASERRSPIKKTAHQQLSRSASQQQFYPGSSSMIPQGESRSTVQAYAQPRRSSQPEYPQHNLSLARGQTGQYYYPPQPASATARMQSNEGTLVYDYQSASGFQSAQLAPSSSPSGNPPLIRTSTLHQSPSAPGISVPTSQGFNPYAMYPANTKAMLKLEGDLGSMVDQWTDVEWEAKRRLVQFQRSQSGSVISTTFEAVTLEQRAPNSICVSCIWWEEKRECYVTSVDTIQLLESLVGVRFTVEEKNRIRRNLEGFRPATVSKTKQDSEEFFKLIMGFPNPKPRNIEKDVKVFPWRILATALKKIIGKYSASYSSTAGALHTPAAVSYTSASMEQRTLASPRSTSSSTPSQQPGYAAAVMTTQGYVPQYSSTPTADMSAGPTGLRLNVPQGASSWQHQTSSANYGASHADLSGTAGASRVPSWDYAANLSGYSLTTAASGSSSQYHFGGGAPQQNPPAASPSSGSAALLGQQQQQQVLGQRWIPLSGYGQHEHSQPTTKGA